MKFALELADIRPMQVGSIRQFLLADFAQLP